MERKKVGSNAHRMSGRNPSGPVCCGHRVLRENRTNNNNNTFSGIYAPKDFNYYVNRKTVAEEEKAF